MIMQYQLMSNRAVHNARSPAAREGLAHAEQARGSQVGRNVIAAHCITDQSSISL